MENNGASKPTDDAIPRKVIQAILQAWPNEAVEILKELQHNHFGGHYYIHRYGMYIGIEYDGYIHT